MIILLGCFSFYIFLDRDAAADAGPGRKLENCCGLNEKNTKKKTKPKRDEFSWG